MSRLIKINLFLALILILIFLFGCSGKKYARKYHRDHIEHVRAKKLPVKKEFNMNIIQHQSNES